MPRSYILFLEDILVSIHKIQNYAGSDSLDSLFKNEMKIDAIVRNFEIIGQASKNIPQEIKDGYPFIEWKKIASFRDILAHEYFGVDYDIMWDIIENKLPDLLRDIKGIIDGEHQ